MVPSPSFLILLNRFKILSSGNRNELVAVGCRRCCRILAVIIKKRIPRSGEASITESVDRKTVLFLICSAFYSASGYNQIRGRVVHAHLIVLMTFPAAVREGMTRKIDVTAPPLAQDESDDIMHTAVPKRDEGS